MKRALLFSIFFAGSAHATEAPLDNAEFRNVVRGPFIAGSFGTSPVGDALLGRAGANLTGTRSIDERRWLLVFDLDGSFVFGIVGNQKPIPVALGMEGNASAEFGRRIWHDRKFSPFVGGKLAGSMRLLEHPGLAADALDTFNDSGFGLLAQGLVRLEAGISLLEGSRSFLLTPFLQERARGRTHTKPAQAFTQVGLGMRFDLPRSWMLDLEGAWGVTTDRTDVLRGTADQTTNVYFSGGARKIFGNFWLGLTLGYARDTDVLTYTASKTRYSTGDAPVFDAILSFGWSPK